METSTYQHLRNGVGSIPLTQLPAFQPHQIRALLDGAKLAGCDACIFSAFGCGAFGNPPEEINKKMMPGEGGRVLGRMNPFERLGKLERPHCDLTGMLVSKGM